MTDSKNGIKVTLADTVMFPSLACIDPSLTLSMPGAIVASSCCDLFSHAVEAYWNRNATPITDSMAREAISRFLAGYRGTYTDPGAPGPRAGMCMAGVFAGMAFSNTRTTASHSVSYPLTIMFGIPHGIACMLTLGEMLMFNAGECGGKVRELCGIMGCAGPEEAFRMIKAIMSDLGVKTRLRDHGLSREDLNAVLERGFTPERMGNNPREVSRKDLSGILERIF
jgi:alcohol dehydrogenase